MSSLTTGTTTGTAAVLTADTTGDCIIKTGSSATTAMTISGSTQAVTLAGSLVMGSATLTAPTGSAPQFTARAWVNFNGTGTVAIRASGNVSSITDNGVGDYTVNFTTAMPDANYSLVGAASDCVYGANLYIRDEGVMDLFAGSARVIVRSGNGATPATADPDAACVSIFR